MQSVGWSSVQICKRLFHMDCLCVVDVMLALSCVPEGLLHSHLPDLCDMQYNLGVEIQKN